MRGFWLREASGEKKGSGDERVLSMRWFWLREVSGEERVLVMRGFWLRDGSG